MTNAILRGEPDAGNTHVRFDEREVASEKPRRGFLLYKLASYLVFVAALAGIVPVAEAAWLYHFPSGQTEWYWDDTNCWTDDNGVHGWPGSDAHCNEAGTILVTNVWTKNTYDFQMKTPASSGGLTLRILKGGKTSFSGVNPGWGATALGRILVDAGGTLAVGEATIGSSGTAVVTNYGSIVFSENSTIAKSAGSHGEIVVRDGGTFSPGYWYKTLTIGKAGEGRLWVTNATASWDKGSVVVVGSAQGGFGHVLVDEKGVFGASALKIGNQAGSTGEVFAVSGSKFFAPSLIVGNAGQGLLRLSDATVRDIFSKIVVGNGQGGVGTVELEGNVRILTTTVCLGGDSAGQGHGTMRMRGATVANNVDNGNMKPIWFLGCGTNELGQLSGTTYGCLRGWGSFDGDDGSGPSGQYSDNRRWGRSIYAQMGHGEIVGDGEGDESHVLDLHKAFYLMTNVLFGVQTTSGWRAQNKGAVRLSQRYVGNYTCTSYTVSLGCDPNLETPDLVNAVRVSCSGMVSNKNKYFGMQVLASDRTDAYTNALPAECNVLSVHRLGILDDVSSLVPVAFAGASSVKIRYDQTKLTGSAKTRLELWRYSAANSRWTRLTKLAPGERPSDLCISGSFTGQASGETYNVGTFAVVERKVRGLTVTVR